MNVQKKLKKLLIYALALVLLLSTGCTDTNKAQKEPGIRVTPEDKLSSSVNYLYATDKKPDSYKPEYDWNMILFSDSETDPQIKVVYKEYKENHINNLKEHLVQKEGKINKDRPTDYARVSIMLKKAGYDPADFEGYNFLTPLDDEKRVTEQGYNAEAYALIAANYCGYRLENEEVYYNDLLNCITNREDYESDEIIDYEAMAIYALTYYAHIPDTSVGIDIALERMADFQADDGSFLNAESTAQLIIALSSLGIDVTDYGLLIKDGNTLMDGLMEYSYEDGFMHVKDKPETNGMATQQAALAIISQKHLSEGGLFPKSEESEAREANQPDEADATAADQSPTE